jgi:IBR domain, a half RING-finger domain
MSCAEVVLTGYHCPCRRSFARYSLSCGVVCGTRMDNANQFLINYKHLQFAGCSVDAHDLLAARNRRINELAAVFEIPFEESEAILHAAGWDLERAAVFAAEKSISSTTWLAEGSACARKAWTRPTGRSRCAVCFIDVDGLTGAFETDCRGILCDACWKKYLRSSITEKASVVVCPMPACKTMIPRDLAERILAPAGSEEPYFPDGPTLLQAFDRIQIDDFLRRSREYCECPSSSCGKLIFRAHRDEFHIVCACGNSFCWRCKGEWHAPLSCHVAGIWLSKSDAHFDQTSSSLSWISRNTKPCPHCRVPIEKIGGCNQMYCTVCHKGFLWEGAAAGASTSQNQSGAPRAHSRHSFAFNEYSDIMKQFSEDSMERKIVICGLPVETIRSTLEEVKGAYDQLKWVHAALAILYKEVCLEDNSLPAIPREAFDIVEFYMQTVAQDADALRTILASNMLSIVDESTMQTRQRLREYRRLLSSVTNEIF